jgi:hypothetical protein
MFSRSPPVENVGRDVHVHIRRQIRGLIAKTLVFFAEREEHNLVLVREHLLFLRDARPTDTQSQNLRTAHTLLTKKAEAFNEAFRSALHSTIDEEARLAFPQAAAGYQEPPKRNLSQEKGDFSLTLMEATEMDRRILLDRVSQVFTAHYEPSLTPLTERLSALLGLDAVMLSRNPFRPEVFVRAFMQAWENAEMDPQATEDLMLSLDPRCFINLTPLYVELNAILTQAGVAAQPELRIRRTPGQTSAYVPLDTAAAALNKGDEGAPATSAWAGLMPAGRSIATHARHFLQRLGMLSGQGAQAGRGDGSGSPGQDGQMQESLPVADAEFLGYLADLQADAHSMSSHMRMMEGSDPADHNILRQMRDLDQVRRAPDLDRGTVDALAEVFDYVFADQSIPVQMKFVIGRLQIPVLKAAMIDRDFFLSTEHPARRLVDTLAQASVAWAPEKGETDPLYVRIENTVKRVLTEFEDDLDLFRDLLREFTEFLFETEQQVQGRIEPAAIQERQGESYEQALAHADEVVHARINALPPETRLAPFLAPFLITQWREVLARAWQALEADPQQWESALKTMDQLIWSTQPKTQPDERRQLVAVLPELVRSLNEGLDANGWNGKARSTFTQRLITTHMLAIRMTQGPSADTATAELEESAGQEAMQELDARLAAQLSGEGDEFDTLAQSLTRGVWFDFDFETGTRHRCRLSWVSPMRTRLLFTNRDGFDAFVRSEREVAELLREGRLSVIDQVPIVSRALDHILASDNLQLES